MMKIPEIHLPKKLPPISRIVQDSKGRVREVYREGSDLPWKINLFDDNIPAIKTKQPVYDRLLSIDNLSDANKYIDSLDTDNYIYLLHMANELAPLHFLNGENFHVASGIEETTYLTNSLKLKQYLQTMSLGHGHHLSRDMVIIKIPKKELSGRGRLMNLVEDFLMDKSSETGSVMDVPNRYIDKIIHLNDLAVSFKTGGILNYLDYIK